MNANNNPFPKFIDLIVKNKDFFPPNDIAPVSMAVAVFACIFAFFGMITVLVGQKIFLHEWIVNTGIIIFIIGLLITLVAMLHYVFWFLKKIFDNFK